MVQIALGMQFLCPPLDPIRHRLMGSLRGSGRTFFHLSMPPAQSTPSGLTAKIASVIAEKVVITMTVNAAIGVIVVSLKIRPTLYAASTHCNIVKQTTNLTFTSLRTAANQPMKKLSTHFIKEAIRF